REPHSPLGRGAPNSDVSSCPMDDLRQSSCASGVSAWGPGWSGRPGLATAPRRTGRKGEASAGSRARGFGSQEEVVTEMEFAFTEAQQHWHDEAARLGREELGGPEAARRDARGEFWRGGYVRCAELGLAGLPVPCELGGQGQDVATTVAAMEGLGYGCPDTGLIFALNASLWTVTMPILAFGSAAQKRRYLPGLCDGRL